MGGMSIWHWIIILVPLLLACLPLIIKKPGGTTVMAPIRVHAISATPLAPVGTTMRTFKAVPVARNIGGFIYSCSFLAAFR